MPKLDLQSLDPGGMYDAILGLPRHLREGRERAGSVDPRFRADDARCVVIAGMGGSAIGGDLLAALATSSARIPVIVSRSYTLPAYVDESTLVVISSFSGNTEETLAAMEEAQARRARILCIASGGEVAQRAERDDLPLYRLPGGMQPRAALGYALSTLLTMAEQIGLISVGDESWEEACSILESQGAALANVDENPALALARRLQDRLPFIYSGGRLMAPVNTRWCCQIEENAKMLAHGAVFPEQNHNEIVGWDEAFDLHGRIVIVALRDRMDHPRVVRRLDLTRELLAPRAAEWIDVESRGASDLARMLSLIQLGDWTSLYLALIRNVDPTPVRLIDRLKQGL
ncbi:MAG TPA: bifunctional phosphoglucose/phosphomannose isomerase [Rhodothermales bacterium]